MTDDVVAPLAERFVTAAGAVGADPTENAVPEDVPVFAGLALSLATARTLKLPADDVQVQLHGLTVAVHKTDAPFLYSTFATGLVPAVIVLAKVRTVPATYGLVGEMAGALTLGGTGPLSPETAP